MIWLKALKWAKNIPVLFAHFPGPAVMLVVVAMIAAATMASCVTNKLNAGTLAETKIELAQCRVGHAEAVSEAAKVREGRVISAFEEKSAIEAENQRAWLEQIRALIATANDKAALARLAKQIEDLHNDPAFDCRRLGLPDLYIRGLHIPAEEVIPASGRP